MTYEEASSVATLMQSGYAAGLLFLCPLGDIVRRRPFILGLTWVTALLVSLSPIPNFNSSEFPLYHVCLQHQSGSASA